jgi:dUTP pyrophosphatase
MQITVKVKKLYPDSKLPIYATHGSAGFDLYSAKEIIIPPGEIAKVHTGIKFEVPPGYCWQLWDRGGLGAKGIHRFGGLGDSDYRGEPIVVLYNSTKQSYKIQKGDRIIQVVIVPIAKVNFQEVDELNQTKRGEGRFHSTGKK